MSYNHRVIAPFLKSPEQERRATAERRANEEAAALGQPLPFPNPWDGVDHTKVPRHATHDELQASYAAFRVLCPPRARKQHRL
jgi:hypothetical protein